jgi:hypothetical protein
MRDDGGTHPEYAPPPRSSHSPLSVNQLGASTAFGTQSAAAGTVGVGVVADLVLGSTVEKIDRLDGVNGEMFVDRSASSGMESTADRIIRPSSGVLSANTAESVRAQRRTNLFSGQLSASFLFRRRLIEQLRQHRDALVDAWSLETVYPGTDSTQLADRPASIGQCGVSSAWLLPRLSWLRRFRATYCVGYVVFDGRDSGSEALHCWIEIGGARSGRRLVIDLTCDQFKDLSHQELVCEPHKSLVNQSIEYRADNRMRFKDLREDPVWRRYEVLEAAIRPSTQQGKLSDPGSERSVGEASSGSPSHTTRPTRLT